MTFIIIVDNSYGMGTVWLKVYQNTVAHVFYILNRLYLIASGALLIAFPTVSIKKRVDRRKQKEKDRGAYGSARCFKLNRSTGER